MIKFDFLNFWFFRSKIVVKIESHVPVNKKDHYYWFWTCLEEDIHRHFQQHFKHIEMTWEVRILYANLNNWMKTYENTSSPMEFTLFTYFNWMRFL